MSAAACHLGIGAILYLQILKTFVILFIVLTLINIPIIGLYANSSKTNMTNFEEVFAYFTLGNLGRGEDHCGYTVLSGGSRKNIELNCGSNVYLKDIERFGILYKNYLPTNTSSSAKDICD